MSAKKLIFIHIPKAAGSSFREATRRHLGPNRVCWQHDGLKINDIGKMVASGKTNFDIIGGHFTMKQALEKFGSENFFFATLREPVERAISLFHFIRRTKAHALNKKLSEMSMLQAIDQVPEFRNAISNRQCYFLSEDSSNSADAAFESIRQNKIFVNTMNYKSMLLPKVTDVLKLSHALEEVFWNQSPTPIKESGERSDPELVSTIAALNRNDTCLFNTIDGFLAKRPVPEYSHDFAG